MVYPDDLDLLLKKRMALRVKVQPTFNQTFVFKLEVDESFVNKIENYFIL